MECSLESGDHIGLVLGQKDGENNGGENNGGRIMEGRIITSRAWICILLLFL